MQEHGIHKSVADLRPCFLTSDFPTQPQEMLQGESLPSQVYEFLLRIILISQSQLPFLVEVKMLEHHIVLYSVSDIAPLLPSSTQKSQKQNQTNKKPSSGA